MVYSKRLTGLVCANRCSNNPLEWADAAGPQSPNKSPSQSPRHSFPAGPLGSGPPEAPNWEATATAWLLDLCPPEYRTYPTLRRHAVVLARFAVLHVEACQAAVNQGLSEARGGLREVADELVVEAAVRPGSASRPA